ncbi:MAG: short chain dehydrogenase [Burkholderiaceae bacterium]|nr:MAG: short chain dehydrogenase [Burkholderiaceae bacterium]
MIGLSLGCACPIASRNSVEGFVKKRKLLLVGSTGVIGAGLKAAFVSSYELITGGIDHEDIYMDLSSVDSIKSALKEIGTIDALVCTAGQANFRPLASIDAAGIDKSVYSLGLQNKLLGQVNLALAARAYTKTDSVIVLTSGTTNRTPILGGSSLGMVNGALDAWVKAAATELPNGPRINCVSPSLVEGTPMQFVRAFPGFAVVPMHHVVLAYIRCLESGINGETVVV